MYESRAALSDPLFFLSQPCGEEIEFSLQRHFAILRCDSRSTARLPSEAVGGVWSMCEVSMINVFGRLAAGWDGGVCVVLSRWWEVDADAGGRVWWTSRIYKYIRKKSSIVHTTCKRLDH